MNSSEKNETQSQQLKCEFQVIVIVEDDDGRLFPLTQDIPKCLLPIANRPLLAYTLDTIRNSGALEIFVVAAKEHHEILSRFLFDYVAIDDKIKIDLVTIPNDDINGSADYVRAVSHKITQDFIVVNGDMISEVSIAELTRLYRLKNADMMVLLTPFQSVEGGDEKKPSKSGPKSAAAGEKKVKIDEEDQEYIGVCTNDGRLVLKSAVVEVEKNIVLDKRILNKCQDSLLIRNDLLDVGIYVFSHWIIHLLLDKKKISSIKIELIPYLLNKQFIQNTKYLIAALGDSLLQRPAHRNLNEVDTYLYNNHKHCQTNANSNRQGSTTGLLKDLSNTVLEQFLIEIDNKESSKSTHHSKLVRQGSNSPVEGGGNDRNCDSSVDSDGNENENELDYIRNSIDSEEIYSEAPKFTGDMENALKILSNVDLIRCFSMIAYAPPSTPSAIAPIMNNAFISSNTNKNAGVLAAAGIASDKFICHRIMNIQTYLQLNRDVPIKLQNNKSFSNFVNTTAYNCSSGCIQDAAASVPVPPAAVSNNSSTNPPAPPGGSSAPGPPPTTAAPAKISQGYHQKTMCMVGTDVEIGLKAVTKQCNIGNGVKIGPRSKLNNCVVMDGVSIGENTIVQNSILCAGVSVENNCNLNDCYIGQSVRIPTLSKMKGEVMALDM